MLRKFFFLILTSLYISLPIFLLATPLLKIGVTQFPYHLHPLDTPMLVKNFALGMASRPITVFNQKLKPECKACRTLPNITKYIIGNEIHYTLRDDLFWGDGIQLTSTDILFTWEVAKDKKTALSTRLFFKDEIASIQIHDAFHFSITRNKGNNLFPEDLSDFWILPAHLEKPIYEKNPRDYLKNSHYIKTPTHPGLYWGPYLISLFDPAHHLIYLEKNPYWKGTTPAFDKINIIAYKNNFALEAALLTKNIDMTGLPSFNLNKLLSLKDNSILKNNYKISSHPSLTLELIMLNLSDPILADSNIRKAIYESINWQKITKRLLTSYAEYSVHFLPLSSNGKNPYNPIEGKKRLLKSGWSYHLEKRQWIKGSQSLNFTIDYPAGNPLRKNFLELAQYEWDQKGIKVVLIPHEPAFFFSKVLKERRFKHMALIGWPMLPGSIPENTFSTRAIPTASNGYVGYNYMGFRSKAMDHLLLKIQNSTASQKRNKLFQQFEEILKTERPLFPLFLKDRFYIHPPQLQNLNITGQLYPASLWIEDWVWQSKR